MRLLLYTEFFVVIARSEATKQSGKNKDNVLEAPDCLANKLARNDGKDIAIQLLIGGGK